MKINDCQALLYKGMDLSLRLDKQKECKNRDLRKSSLEIAHFFEELKNIHPEASKDNNILFKLVNVGDKLLKQNEIITQKIVEDMLS